MKVKIQKPKSGSVYLALCLIFSFLVFASQLYAEPLNQESMVNSSRQGKYAEVIDIRHWSNPAYTRVVIHLTGEVQYESRLLKEDPSIQKPKRFLIDLKNSVLSPNLKEVAINDGLLKMARAGQNTKDTVRVVLDIESIEDYKIFQMEDPFRIVIDVMGKGHAKLETKQHPQKDERPIAQKQSGIKIVLDAGHGGHDPGAVGKNRLQEKDVALKIIKALKENLEGGLHSDVILTRDDDVFISLEERTAIANTKNADIFVSVHVNASFNREASGVETYYLDLTNDEVAMRVAARENAVSTKKMSDLQYILNDLMKTAKSNESSKLALNIHGALVSTLKYKYSDVKSNGVKGAPFYVLVGTHMPSILLEVSYISNLREEARLRDDAYIKEIVRGITAGIKDYLKEMGTGGL
ncbi:MAG: N-acetylmuramoyl-L-alanine amidase [Deltaproteobacteria bacterium]|nr:N-acetylmuramoyl-L-alanine amidase [Deltaproteobacteria bacterium]